MKESYFGAKYIKPLLKKHLAWHMNVTADTPELKGTADYIGMTKNGRFIGIEIKNETRQAEPEQISWKKNIEKDSGLAFIVFIDEAGMTQNTPRKIKSRVEKGYTPYTEFKKIMEEL